MLEIATRLRRRAGEEEMHVETSDALIEIADVIEEVLDARANEPRDYGPAPGEKPTFVDGDVEYYGELGESIKKSRGERESGDCEHRWVQRPGFQNTFCDRCGSFPGPESLDNIRQNGERESGEEVSN